MRDLADLLGVTGRAVTPLVDALEADGLIARTADPADRRAFRITLTDAGLTAIDRIARLQHEVSAEIFNGMTTSERTELARLLRAFLATTPDRLR